MTRLRGVRTCALLLLWVVASLSTAAQEGPAYAVERVIDGDTIVL